MRLYLKMKILARFGSQRAFAQATGLSDDRVSRLVRGLREPKDDEIRLICEALGDEYGEQLFFETRLWHEQQ